MRSVMIRGIAAATALALVGCTSTSRLVDRQNRQAKIRLESSPPGAAVLVNRKVVAPATPADVTVPYTFEKRLARDGDYDTGLLLLVSGAIGFVAGIGLAAWGFSGVSDSSLDSSATDTSLQALGGTFGSLAIIYGLIGVGAGGYLMWDARPDEIRTTTDPKTMTIGLDLPQLGLREIELAHKNRDRADYGDDLGIVRYRARTDLWEAPNLPPSLTYKYEPDEGRIAAAVAATGNFSGGQSAPSPSPTPTGPAAVVAVFDINVSGQSLDGALVSRMSDYLAMRLATERRFSVVPRDQLRARLRDQKKQSYDKCFDQSCQIEIGKELAAEKSLSSAIVRFGRVCKVTAVLYDLRTSASEGGATASGPCSESSLVASLEEVVQKLAN